MRIHAGSGGSRARKADAVALPSYTAYAKPEVFVRVVSRMTSDELVRMGNEMAATGLTGREVVGRACAAAGKWEHLILEPLR